MSRKGLAGVVIAEEGKSAYFSCNTSGQFSVVENCPMQDEHEIRVDSNAA
jgi:hypothetical protein